MDVFELGQFVLERGTKSDTHGWVELDQAKLLISSDGFWLNDDKAPNPGLLVQSRQVAHDDKQALWHAQSCRYAQAVLAALAEEVPTDYAALWSAVWQNYALTMHPYLVPLLIANPLLVTPAVPEYRVTLRLNPVLGFEPAAQSRVLRPALTLAVA